MQGNVGVLFGVDDTCTGFGECSEDHVSACDHLGAGRTYADENLAARDRAAGSGRSKPPASRAPPSDLNANLASHGKVNRANQPRMGDESTRRSRRCWSKRKRGSMRRSLIAREKCPHERSPAAGSARRHRPAERSCAKCESEPIQRLLPPPWPSICGVASASSTWSTAESSMQRQDHNPLRPHTPTSSSRGISRCGRRCTLSVGPNG